MEDYFRAEYVPTKPIKLVDIKHCSVIESMRIQSAPGDVVAVKKGNETIRRIIGLSTKGFSSCYERSVKSIVENIDWIESIVWG